ncbi:MAG: hypothetical protein K9K93_01015 [Acholeplasmataceae bacterium]|nr:hypothetical protein [Acholeplasmataceae bacterium]
MRQLKTIHLTPSYDTVCRPIRILIPDGKGPFDVLYMHDGQNLFESNTAYGGVSWGIPETLDQLCTANLIKDLIVVGIDNSPMRMHEYSYFNAVPNMIEGRDLEGPPKGHQYAHFLITDVIPAIESMFEVNQNPAGRMIAGSSMGALISAEIALSNPHLFGVIGCFSLASWFSEDDFLNMVNEASVNPGDRYWISVGRCETSNEKNPKFNELYIKNAQRFKDALLAKGIRDVFYVENKEAHHEYAWKQAFLHFMLWARKNG